MPLRAIAYIVYGIALEVPQNSLKKKNSKEIEIKNGKNGGYFGGAFFLPRGGGGGGGGK